MLHIRLSRIAADPPALDDCVAYIESEARQALEFRPGSLGISVLADRAEGVALFGSVWASWEAMSASEETEAPLRAELAKRAGRPVTVDDYHGASDTGPEGAAGPRPRVAVLGTGIMGGAMARNLIRAGLRVDVWERRPEAMWRLTEAGATAYVGPDKAVAHAEDVITMLPDAAAVTSVAIGQGVLAALKQGTIWAQVGTIGVRATQQLAASVADQRSGVLFVDAPVSGTRQPAEAGQLLIFASGPESTRAVLALAFGAIGSRTPWLGEAGAGSRLKLVLNTWLAFLMEGIAESVALADAIGVDHEAPRDALQGSPANAPVALLKLAKIDAGDESPDFSLRWATKDVDLALAEAGDQTLPVATAIDHRRHALVEAGLGQADVSAVRQGLGEAAVKAEVAADRADPK